MTDTIQLTYTLDEIKDLREEVNQDRNRLYDLQTDFDEKVAKLIEMREVYKKETSLLLTTKPY